MPATRLRATARHAVLGAALVLIMAGAIGCLAETASAATPPVRAVAGTTSLTGIACSGGDCVAVGDSATGGVVLPAPGGVPASPVLTLATSPACNWPASRAAAPGIAWPWPRPEATRARSCRSTTACQAHPSSSTPRSR